MSKKITVGQLRNLLNQLDSEEISFSRMVEILNETNRDLLKESNELLPSVYQVIERKGENTNWGALKAQVYAALKEQNKVLYPFTNH